MPKCPLAQPTSMPTRPQMRRPRPRPMDLTIGTTVMLPVALREGFGWE